MPSRLVARLQVQNDDAGRNRKKACTLGNLERLRSRAWLSNQVRRLKGQPRVSSAIAANSLRIFVRILGPDGESDASARGKLRGHYGLARRTRFHKVIEDAVGYRFVKCPLVAIRGEIKLERLAFNAETVRHVVEVDPGEIGLAGHRAKRSEIVGLKMNPIISSGGIWKCFQ